MRDTARHDLNRDGLCGWEQACVDRNDTADGCPENCNSGSCRGSGGDIPSQFAQQLLLLINHSSNVFIVINKRGHMVLYTATASIRCVR